MSGTAVRHSPARLARRPASGGALGLLAGLAVCFALGLACVRLGRLVPVFGGPAFGIVFGMLISTARPLRGVLHAGARFAGRQVLQLSVVILGAELSMRSVVRIGVTSLPVMLGTLALALLGARVFGAMLGVKGELRSLIGVGTGVCGASAIAAVTRVIGAAESSVAYSMSTIFAFNVVAVLLYPQLGHLLGMSQHTFGLWSGTAINDTSSVVAATAIYGDAASSYGIVVKLTRALMIVPICAWFAWRQLKRQREKAAGGAGAAAGGDPNPAGAMPKWHQLVPWFIGYFLLAVIANTIGLVPTSWQPGLSTTATLLITTALVGVGLSARFDQMRRSGLRPLALGAALWATVGLSSLALQAIF